MKQVFSESFNSLIWNQEDPVPQGFVLIYEPEYQYEYAVPSDWYVSGTGDLSYAQNSDGTASITVTPAEFTESVQDIKAEDLSAMLNPDGSKNNFLLRQFDVSDDKGIAVSAYTTADAVVQEKTLVYPYHGILYLATFSYMQGMISDEDVLTCLSLFRPFLDEPMSPEAKETDSEDLYQADIQDAENEIDGYFAIGDN